MKVIGDIACQGAVFVYKAENTATAAWGDVERIYKGTGAIRGELHQDKAEMLSGIKRWNEGVDPSNAFLCLYAHMGSPGINCISGNQPTRITGGSFKWRCPEASNFFGS